MMETNTNFSQGGKNMQTDFSIPTLLSASTLNGTKVENPNGDNLGKLEELMVDLSNGRIAYAVLSFGGILGIGDKLFAIPWDALYVDTRNKVIVLDVDKQSLENAPGFDKDNWPDTSDHAWLVNVYNYYGSSPYWK
jgi:sporulation protein YlmC with PRC-barrel domain